MNDVIAQLHDIQQPDAISIWPLAMGWWLLLALVVFIIIAAISYSLYWKKHKQYRKHALVQLTAIYAQHNDADFLLKTASVLKQTALKKYPDVAQMSGQQWQLFLQRTMDEKNAYLFAVSRYQKCPDFDKQQVFNAATQWIKAHQ